MSLEHFKSNTNLNSKIHQAFTPELSIYNQAVLKRTEPITSFKTLNSGRSDEMSIMFYLKGELEGKIICTISLDCNESKTDRTFLKSLFTESMNILLGKFLTELEDETGLMSLLSSPQQIEISEFKLNGRHSVSIKTKYDLLTIKKSHSCVIYILANKTITKEV